PGADELVAGRQQRHAGPPCAGRLGDPDRRQHGKLGGSQPGPGAEDGVAGAHVLAGAADVAARPDGDAHLDRRVARRRVLDRHHGVRALATSISSAGMAPVYTRTMEPIVGAVLAGGASRRMGAPKALLELGGRPLLEYPLAALQGAGLQPVVVAKRRSPLPPLAVPRW